MATQLALQLAGGQLPEIEKAVNHVWENVYYIHSNNLSHYFRNLYHVIIYVDKSTATKDKTTYTSLVRAQLSVHEHIALFFNGISGYGHKRFKPLIEAYALLENVRLETFSALNPRLLLLYKPQAYGDDIDRVTEILAKSGLSFPCSTNEQVHMEHSNQGHAS